MNFLLHDPIGTKSTDCRQWRKWLFVKLHLDRICYVLIYSLCRFNGNGLKDRKARFTTLWPIASADAIWFSLDKLLLGSRPGKIYSILEEISLGMTFFMNEMVDGVLLSSGRKSPSPYFSVNFLRVQRSQSNMPYPTIIVRGFIQVRRWLMVS